MWNSADAYAIDKEDGDDGFNCEQRRDEGSRSDHKRAVEAYKSAAMKHNVDVTA